MRKCELDYLVVHALFKYTIHVYNCDSTSIVHLVYITTMQHKPHYQPNQFGRTIQLFLPFILLTSNEYCFQVCHQFWHPILLLDTLLMMLHPSHFSSQKKLNLRMTKKVIRIPIIICWASKRSERDTIWGDTIENLLYVFTCLYAYICFFALTLLFLCLLRGRLLPLVH